MKKAIATLALMAVVTLSANAQQQEPKQKKKAKTEKSCDVNGKKCFAGDVKKGGATEKKDAHCDMKKAATKS